MILVCWTSLDSFSTDLSETGFPFISAFFRFRGQLTKFLSPLLPSFSHLLIFLGGLTFTFTAEFSQQPCPSVPGPLLCLPFCQVALVLEYVRKSSGDVWVPGLSELSPHCSGWCLSDIPIRHGQASFKMYKTFRVRRS